MLKSLNLRTSLLNAHKLKFFLALTAVILATNSYHLFKQTQKIAGIRAVRPYFFMGSQFENIRAHLINERFIGYYTDYSLDDRSAAMQFAQTQYTMAPIILDIDNMEHRFILFDCKNEQLAQKKIRELGAVSLGQNALGVILAFSPRHQEGGR